MANDDRNSSSKWNSSKKAAVTFAEPCRDYRPLVYKRSWPVPSCMLGLIQNLASLFFVKKNRLPLFSFSCLYSGLVLRTSFALLHNSAALLDYFVFFLVLLLHD